MNENIKQRRLLQRTSGLNNGMAFFVNKTDNEC